MEKRFLNVPEVAVYLGFKQSAIRKWIRQGRIPFNRFRRNIRFDLKLIEQWADERRENTRIIQ
ncbi:MAG: helix-turn-helix domain-containing protein [Candidatus Omnitrophica bacterium]|nr:helix-turn-helix domain-containing protein [Candidatus Omnitrophota bacterium]